MKFTISLPWKCLGSTNSCKSCYRKWHVFPFECISFRTLDYDCCYMVTFLSIVPWSLARDLLFSWSLSSNKSPMCDPSSSTALLLPLSCLSPLLFGRGAKRSSVNERKKEKSEEGQVRKKFKLPEVYGHSSRSYGSAVFICFSQQEACG